jgi:hypothetical protein
VIGCLQEGGGVKILCAGGTMDATFRVWVGKLLLWEGVDYAATIASGVGPDPRILKSLHLYDEDFTDLVVVSGGGEQK